jgi:hypothetical protein
MLLIVAVLLFQMHTGRVLHAQGRSVSAIITFLKTSKMCADSEMAVLVEYQRKVTASLMSKGAPAEIDVITDAESAVLKGLVARPNTEASSAKE